MRRLSGFCPWHTVRGRGDSWTAVTWPCGCIAGNVAGDIVIIALQELFYLLFGDFIFYVVLPVFVGMTTVATVFLVSVDLFGGFNRD